ncbi:MAG: proton-conducting transporter transmembrane domain-containing protein [Chloroflexota bacterium]
MSAEWILGLAIVVPLAAVPLAALAAGRRQVEDRLALAVLATEAVLCLLLLAAVTGGRTIALPLAQVVVGGWAFQLRLLMGLLGAALLTLAVFLAFLVSAYAAAQGQRLAQQRYQPPLLLLAIGVLAGAFSSGNLLTLYAFWQLAVLATALALSTGLRAVSLRAASRYLVAGEVSALLLLLAAALAASRGAGQTMVDWQRAGDSVYQLAMYLLLGTAAALTLPVPPFHTWQGAAASALEPTFAALWLNFHNKIGFYLLARLAIDGIGGVTPREWLLFLTVLGALAVAVGVISALGQRQAGRLVAFLLMAQAGLVLLGLGAGEPIGPVAALFLMFTQPLAATAVLLAAAWSSGQRSPFRVLAFTAGALSLAGLPPSPGFSGVLLLSEALVSRGDPWRLALIPLLVVATVIGAATLARLGGALFLGWGETARQQGGRLDGRARASVALLGLIVLVLGLFPRLLLDPLVAPLTAASMLGGILDVSVLPAPGTLPVALWNSFWLLALLGLAIALVFVAARVERLNPFPVVSASRQVLLPLALSLSAGKTPALVGEGDALPGSRRAQVAWRWAGTYLDVYGLGTLVIGALARGCALVVRLVFRLLLR